MRHLAYLPLSSCVNVYKSQFLAHPLLLSNFSRPQKQPLGYTALYGSAPCLGTCSQEASGLNTPWFSVVSALRSHGGGRGHLGLTCTGAQERPQPPTHPRPTPTTALGEPQPGEGRSDTTEGHSRAAGGPAVCMAQGPGTPRRKDGRGHKGRHLQHVTLGKEGPQPKPPRCPAPVPLGRQPLGLHSCRKGLGQAITRCPSPGSGRRNGIVWRAQIRNICCCASPTALHWHLEIRRSVRSHHPPSRCWANAQRSWEGLLPGNSTGDSPPAVCSPEAFPAQEQV